MKWYKKLLLLIGLGEKPKAAAIKVATAEVIRAKPASRVQEVIFEERNEKATAYARPEPELKLPTTYKCLKPLSFVKEIVAECEFASSEGYSELRLMSNEPIRLSSSTIRALKRRGYDVRDPVGTSFNLYITFPRQNPAS